MPASLHEPIGDGGWWPLFARLVSKYGQVRVAPLAMPDTDSAPRSEVMNNHLSTLLLRRATLRIRAAVTAGGNPEPVRAAKLEVEPVMLPGWDPIA